MKLQISLIIILSGSLLDGCITKFVPEINAGRNLLVVEGAITDQFETYSVKLSSSSPLGVKETSSPVSRAQVSVTDNTGNIYYFTENNPGVYLSDSLAFRGVIGMVYTLHVEIPNTTLTYLNYESLPMEIKPVPEIDSIYYQKVIIKDSEQFSDRIEACQIFLDTHDDSGECKYFKWDYTETWEFHLHYEQPNKICWINSKSTSINLKDASGLSVDRVNKYPLNFISNNTDKLEVRYSILANQYSISQDEFQYWEKLKNFTEDVGGLYDQVPAYIQGNISSLNDPGEQVLGYFSASAKTSKRIFIKDRFAGQVNLYDRCLVETINNPGVIPGLNSYLWILESHPFATPPYVLITDDRNCVDCTTRGTIVRPSFWDNK